MVKVEPNKKEADTMAFWLRDRRIAFEVTRLDVPETAIELKLIDYKHNCLLVGKKYKVNNVTMDYSELEALIKRFEREEIYPILFDNIKVRLEDAEKPNFRMIRED